MKKKDSQISSTTTQTFVNELRVKLRKLDPAPDGFKTIQQIADEEGVSKYAVGHLITEAVKAGLVETGRFTKAGSQCRVPYYRLKQ
jgi:predicted transcriptional regulator